MIRIYSVFEDPLDESGVNLSFADVPTQEPDRAFERVERAATSGELWKRMYPSDLGRPYTLLADKMMYLNISGLPHEASPDTVLPI